MALPNMTDDVANSILDWLDPDDTPRSDGAEDDYYSSLPNPYHCKNGPLDSLEELLLVKGVTPHMLYGNDRNRNGVLDPDEDDGGGQVDLGWSAYLTVYSHEPNTDVNGNPRIYINDPDIDTLANNLTPVLGQDMANYIIAYRLYGAASTTASTGAAGGAAAGDAGSPAGGAGRRVARRRDGAVQGAVRQRRGHRSDPRFRRPARPPPTTTGSRRSSSSRSTPCSTWSTAASTSPTARGRTPRRSRCPARSTTPASCRRCCRWCWTRRPRR